MKTFWIFTFALVISTSSIWAQNHSHCRKEQIRANKVAFITDKLQLTVEEAQNFWPLYNEMEKKQDEINKKHKEIMRNYLSNKESLSDKELEEMYDQLNNLDKQEAELAVEYDKKFKSVLPVKKLFELKEAEKQFKHELLLQLKEGGQNCKQN